MPRHQNQPTGTTQPRSPQSLTDADMTTVRVDRRSFLSRAVVAGSVAAGAALTAACPGGTDSDGASDSDGGGQ